MHPACKEEQKRIQHMKSSLYFFSAILISGILGSSAMGETPSETTSKHQPKTCQQQMSLYALRAYALANSPLVAQIDLDYAKELAQALKTETLENPELHSEYTVTREKLGGANDPQVQISLGQRISLSNFGSRAEVARLLRKSGDIRKRIKLIQLLQNLTLQYDTLAVFQQLETMIRDAEKSAGKKVLLIREGVRKGLLSDGDEHLFEGEKFRLQAQGNNIASTISRLRSELSLTTGSPCSLEALASDNTADIPPAEDLIAQAETSDISETARIDILLHLNEEQLKVAQMDVYPSITPQLIYQHTNDGGDFIGAGFTIPLPFWNRNQSELTRSTAEKKAVDARFAFLRAGGLKNQIITLRDAVTNALEHSQIFREKVVPSFEKALKSQERLYYQGKSNVLQVWQLFTTLNQVKAEGLQHRLESHALKMQLSALIGKEF